MVAASDVGQQRQVAARGWGEWWPCGPRHCGGRRCRLAVATGGAGSGGRWSWWSLPALLSGGGWWRQWQVDGAPLAHRLWLFDSGFWSGRGTPTRLGLPTMSQPSGLARPYPPISPRPMTAAAATTRKYCATSASRPCRPLVRGRQWPCRRVVPLVETRVAVAVAPVSVVVAGRAPTVSNESCATPPACTGRRMPWRRRWASLPSRPHRRRCWRRSRPPLLVGSPPSTGRHYHRPSTPTGRSCRWRTTMSIRQRHDGPAYFSSSALCGSPSSREQEGDEDGEVGAGGWGGGLGVEGGLWWCTMHGERTEGAREAGLATAADGGCALGRLRHSLWRRRTWGGGEGVGCGRRGLPTGRVRAFPRP